MNPNETQTNSTLMPKSVAPASNKHCVFGSGTSWFSVPAVCVREIVLLPNLVRVPSCHASLAGICHLRSEFIPVISVNALLGFESRSKLHPHDKLIVIRGTGSQTTGSWAIQTTDEASLESLEALGTADGRTDDTSTSLVIGTAMFREAVVRVLDPTTLYRQVRRVLEDLWNATNLAFDHTPCEHSSRPQSGSQF